MDKLYLFILLSLSVWRISRIVVMEDGPGDVFRLIRERLGIHMQDTWLRRGLACIGCISFWLGLAGGVMLFGFTAHALLAGLGASAVSVILMRKVN